MKKGTPLWKTLLLEHRLPHRYKSRFPWEKEEMRFLDYAILQNLNKILIKLKPLPHYTKEDISVIIGIKDRKLNQLVISLENIRNQNYPQNLINIILVDYDSKKELISKLKKICRKYDVKFIRIENKSKWNRSHCLNIGIKRAKTKYILTSDMDIIFREDYITKSIEELKANPFQVIVSKCYELPKLKMNLDELKRKSKLFITTAGYSCGINLTSNHFYRYIRGYDENYIGWGREDIDLINRFKILGLKIKEISEKTRYFHQKHNSYGNLDSFLLNKEYFKNSKGIKRNKRGWGLI